MGELPTQSDVLRISRRLLEIATRHDKLDPLLRAYVAEVQSITGCEACGIRLLDDEGTIPYQAYDGFDREFDESESPLSIKSDECMCINVIRGDLDPGLPFYTRAGSFFMNATTRFLATVSEQDKGTTRNVCNAHGYESVALVPIRLTGRIRGLVHVADTRQDRVPLETVQLLEELSGLLGPAIEIVRMQQELGQERDLIESLLETAQTLVVLVDMKGRIVRINPYFEKLSGSTLEEVRGADFITTFLPERDRVRDRTRLSELIAGTLGSGSIFPIMTREGRERVIKWLSKPLKDTRGDVTGMLAAGLDVTDQLLVQEDVRKSEEIYRTVVETSPDAITLTDIDGNILSVNRRAMELYGCESQDELVGVQAIEFLDSQNAAHAGEIIQRVFDEGTVRDVEITVPRRDGTTYVAEISISLLKNDQDDPTALLSIYRDVTERKKVDQEIAANQEKLRSLASQLSLAEERERRAIALELHDGIGQTLALASMKLGQVRMSAPPDLEEMLDELKDLWEKAMSYTRSLTVEISPPILYELGLEAALEWLVERQSQFNDTAFRFKDDGLPKPLGEDTSVLLFQATRELLVNVVKHARAGDASVSVSRNGECMLIEVADDGIGFDLEKAQAGEGFGLFNIRERLSIIGGSLDVESRPGRGTRVILQAPLDSKDADTELGYEI